MMVIVRQNFNIAYHYPQEVSLLGKPITLHAYHSVCHLPLGIYQDFEATISPSSRNGPGSSGLHWRHFDLGRVQGDGPRSCGSLSVPAGVPGLCYQQRETSRISGPDRQLSQHGASIPASKHEWFRRSLENCWRKMLPRLAPWSIYLGKRMQ